MSMLLKQQKLSQESCVKQCYVKDTKEEITMKYAKKQITKAIANQKKVLESMQLNESVFDKATLLRDFNTNLNQLDKSLAEKSKYDLEMIKDMIEELPDTHVNSYEGKKVPLENQFAYTIVGFLKTLVYCDATTRKSLSEDEAEEFNIPASEWDKVASYINKGSDFKKVAVMCAKNKVKYTSRYLILKKLGLEQAANAFIDGLHSKLPYSTVEDLKKADVSNIEVPEKYKSLANDKDTLQTTFAANREKFKKAHQAGPLKELAKMGIEYLLCYSDGSGKDGKNIANQLAPDSKIPTYKPSYDWVGNRGLRWDLPLIVYMINGKLKSGSKYFGYVIHTLESVDSGNQGYSLFSYTAGQHTHADGQSMNVTSAIKWIRDNVEKE